ncbi:MAG: hypothetical protein J6S67_26510 [Methanobrevibacter sp.]|nr:hypothetical protein [Methanobrevibacter sp.]MBO7736152.1 hypothetical protein [Methanobrevibacter sp.]
MAKRHYKKRGKVRSAWETYSETYDKLAKKNPDMFYQKLTKKEFQSRLELAKDAGIKNPSREIARSQRKWEYQMARRYKKATGKVLTGRESKEERQQVFEDYVKYFDGDYKKARESFEALY